MQNKAKALVDNYPLYAIDGKIAVDFIGRYENVMDDFAYVLRTIGGPHLDSLPKLNASPEHRDYRTHYTEATRRLVDEWYEPEITAFGYRF
jgi:hypothetical protein